MYPQRQDFNVRRQQTYTAPPMEVSNSEDFLKPRWYNSQEKFTQQQQEQKLLEKFLNPQLQRTDHFLTTPTSKSAYGFPRDIPGGNGPEKYTLVNFDFRKVIDYFLVLQILKPMEIGIIITNKDLINFILVMKDSQGKILIIKGRIM